LSPEAENAHAAGTIRPIVCYVTDRKGLTATDPIAALISSIRSAIAAGVDWVQIREKDLVAREMLAVVTAAVRATQEHRAFKSNPARIIVNDRLDVALAAGAAGVHLGRESLPPADAVRWCRGGNAPPDFSVGVSCHSLADAREAEAAGVSYVVFGPVFDTPAKRPFGPPQGIEKLAKVCDSVRIPVIAIGGIDDENAAECLRAGAAGIAAIRLFQGERDAKSLADRISKLRVRA
jgi:thiamine-phosphate pyrophosphorylase